MLIIGAVGDKSDTIFVTYENPVLQLSPEGNVQEVVENEILKISREPDDYWLVSKVDDSLKKYEGQGREPKSVFRKKTRRHSHMGLRTHNDQRF